MYMRTMHQRTLSPCCKPAFSAGPPGTVHTMHAKVRPSDPVLPPTTLMPNPRAVTKGYNVGWECVVYDVTVAIFADISRVSPRG